MIHKLHKNIKMIMIHPYYKLLNFHRLGKLRGSVVVVLLFYCFYCLGAILFSDLGAENPLLIRV